MLIAAGSGLYFPISHLTQAPKDTWRPSSSPSSSMYRPAGQFSQEDVEVALLNFPAAQIAQSETSSCESASLPSSTRYVPAGQFTQDVDSDLSLYFPEQL